MKQRKYFEMCARVGRPAIPNPDYPYEHSVLLEDMEYARIHGASIIHNCSYDYSFDCGNEMAIDIANKNKRLFPLALVTSTASLETKKENYYNYLLDKGVKGFIYNYGSAICTTLNPKHLSKMCESLINYKKPLIISGLVTNENILKIEELASAYRELPVILKGTSWGITRNLIHVLDNNENIYYDITAQHSNNMLEITKEHFGIHRALYGTAWPEKSMGAMKCFIEYADLSEEEKNMVAYKNACRLYGIDEEDLELYDEDNCMLDEIAKEADEGKPISVPVIDSHAHVKGTLSGSNLAMWMESTVEPVIKKMDRMGVDKIISSPLIGIAYDGIAGNKEVIDIYEKSGGRILGYSTCNVNYEDNIDTVCEFMENNPEKFVGVKPYPPLLGYRFSDERCEKWYEYANKHHLCALIHGGNEDTVSQVDMLAAKYPDITFIVAHCGASYDVARRTIELAKKYKNVMLDITYTSTSRGMVEFLANGAGADRVLYASDLPMRDPSPQLGWVCFARLSVEDKKKILSENITRVMLRKKINGC